MNVDRSRSPPSSTPAGGNQCRHLRRYAVEEECEDPIACTGKSCQSCTAGVIADCVAICFCPCAVVSILTLAFFKLPYAVVRKCIGRTKRKKVLEGGENRITGNGRAESGTWEIEVDDNLSAEFKVDDVWLELYEVGHLSFGRVSFSGNLIQNKED